MESSQRSLPVCLWKKAWRERIHASTRFGDIYSSEVDFSLAIAGVGRAVEVEIELLTHKSRFSLTDEQQWAVVSGGFAVEAKFADIQISGDCLKQMRAIVTLGAGVEGVVWSTKQVFNDTIRCAGGYPCSLQHSCHRLHG